jgi:hypothetical protein
MLYLYITIEIHISVIDNQHSRNYSAKGKGVEDLPDRLAEGKYGI